MVVEEQGEEACMMAWAAYDALPAPVCALSPDGLILYANRALYDLLGQPSGVLAGSRFTRFEPPGAAGEEGDDTPGLRRLRRTDGTSLWVVEAVSTVPGPAGRPVELHVFTDVTARRQREMELRRHVDAQQRLFDRLPVPVFIKDQRGCYVACNAAFEQYTGLSRTEILNKSSFAVMSPRTAKAHVAQDRQLFARQGQTSYEEAVPLADGSTRMVCLTKASLADEGGGTNGIVGVIHDLAEGLPNEARLEAILEQSPVGVSVSRRDDGRIVFVNTRFAELIGLSRERLIGSRARDYYVDDHQRERVLDRLRTAKSVVNMEVQFRRADGSPFWTLFTVNQAVIQGVPVNLAWIYDYTERRNMEEALRDMASRDPLTGIYNRRSFMELGRQQLARAHRFCEPLAVFVLDVDHFKRINDSYGHATGDDALRMVAGGCQTILREYDILGRLGGEEFVVVLPGATADESRVVAERVRRHIARLPIPGPGGPLNVTCSIGIAGVEGATDTLEKAIHRADLALYRAKREGRNRVIVYDPGM
ncbi:diguanylate cyclase [Azospirillum thermophilum]|uniref:Diguanylate cyclase n=2 Tax=Azospirillum thermophilum TaxID=2202148 RepID=A0A2S2CU28_9PROT|nr:diguanylate cyclase [Azospirillum thermophilum]